MFEKVFIKFNRQIFVRNYIDCPTTEEGVSLDKNTWKKWIEFPGTSNSSSFTSLVFKATFLS